MKKLIKKLDRDLKIIKVEYKEDTVIIELKSKKKLVKCPCCGQKQKKVHRRYTKEIKDLPTQEYKTILKIHTRIFFCKNKRCENKRFAEIFNFYENYSRMTNRLKERVIESAKGMSARASKEIINNGIVNISDDTILRLVKKNQQAQISKSKKFA